MNLKKNKLCKCCNNTTQNTETCSHKCGMVYRYLKKFNLTREEIISVLKFTEKYKDLSIKIRYKLYLDNLQDPPRCKICNKEITVLRNNKFSDTCSQECKKIYTLDKNNIKTSPKKQCRVCGKEFYGDKNTCSSKCTKQLNYLKELGVSIEQVRIYKNPYNFNLSQIGVLVSKNIYDKIECPVCKKKYLKMDGVSLYTTCSRECANVYKKSKMHIDDIKEKYSDDILLKYSNIEIYQLFNNHYFEKECDKCGSVFLGKTETHCSIECSSTRNRNNDENFNEKYIKQTFIEKDVFLIQEFMDYFNLSYSNSLTYKKTFNIDLPNRNSAENDLFNLIDDGDAVLNDRTLIYPKEIDILGKSYGIEYNGLMWHSFGVHNSSIFDNFELEPTQKSKHLLKTELCESKGIQLFHVFENEFINNRKLWLSVINNKLGRSKKIYARKCYIEEIPNLESNKFLELNHLQGSCRASVRVGLFHEGELISLMTFGKSRYNNKIEYELIRFCSKLNTSVVGGASKLLKYFELNYKPKSIISYANRRWSQGNVYEKLGFVHKHNSEPNYFYFKPGELKLYSRIQFQKHKLKDKLENFDPKLTETENMYNNNYRKIYDCGNKVYVKEYKYLKSKVLNV